MSYSLDFRERIIDYVHRGGSRSSASRLFKIDPKTLYNWLKSPILPETKPVSIRKGKIDKVLLNKHVQEFPEALLRERAAEFNVCVSAIWRSLSKMKITKKNDKVRRKKLQ
jgi:transposase-like protein